MIADVILESTGLVLLEKQPLGERYELKIGIIRQEMKKREEMLVS
jgi:hypothetical protein